MPIGYSRPISLAWSRMTGLLLHPFDLGRWCVLGFTAFLAALVEGGGAGGSTWRWQEHLDLGRHAEPGRWPGAAADAAHRLMADAWLAAAIVFLVLVGIVLGLAVAWVGSRGQFMFLDNLVHRRAEVSRPWSRFRTEGNSLFLWQVVYGFVVLAVLGLLAVGFLVVMGALGAADAGSMALLPAYLALGTTAFVLVVVLGYVDFFLLHLVVPIMYRRRIGCTAAWALLGHEFRRRPWPFVVYGLLHLGLGLLAVALILTGSLLTCCVGLLLLAIPYVGTVLTLPLPVFVRYLDLEWLGQFGPEFVVPGPTGDGAGSGEVQGDGAVVRAEDAGEDAGTGEPRPQDP